MESVWLNQFRLIVNESYSERGVVVREASWIGEGRRTEASHADRYANSDCDRAIVQWPDSEERAQVGLGSLESHSGSTSISVIRIKRITVITSPGFRCFLRWLMKLYQQERLLSQDFMVRWLRYEKFIELRSSIEYSFIRMQELRKITNKISW